ncbi:hypothetical protein RB213_011028, partial [Colletotrichum asianum]
AGTPTFCCHRLKSAAGRSAHLIGLNQDVLSRIPDCLLKYS